MDAALLITFKSFTIKELETGPLFMACHAIFPLGESQSPRDGEIQRSSFILPISHSTKVFKDGYISFNISLSSKILSSMVGMIDTAFPHPSMERKPIPPFPWAGTVDPMYPSLLSLCPKARSLSQLCQKAWVS